MKQVSIIFPVHNERDTIEEVLQEWTKALEHTHLDYAFIICEDGSTDGTKELLTSIQKKFKLILNQKHFRRGYGGAVIDGITESDSEYILCVDSDGQCDPKDFMSFWKSRKDSDIIIGWRKNRADNQQRKLFSRLFKLSFNMLFGSSVHDPSAPFVLFKKTTAMPLIPYLRFLREGFWWGFIGACHKKNLTVIELPMHHRLRLRGDTQVYKLKEIPRIAFQNFLGLIKLKLSA